MLDTCGLTGGKIRAKIGWLVLYRRFTMAIFGMTSFDSHLSGRRIKFDITPDKSKFENSVICSSPLTVKDGDKNLRKIGLASRLAEEAMEGGGGWGMGEGG